MLIAKIFVNFDQIDEIHIQNTGELEDGIYEYRIRQPEGKFPKITHRREAGYKPLLIKALRTLDRRG